MLDFNKKRDGEPPARLLAQMREKLAADRIPKAFADYLAPFMADPADLTAELQEALRTVVELMKLHEIPPADATELFCQMIDEAEKRPEPAAMTWDNLDTDAPVKASDRLIMAARNVLLRRKGPSVTNHKPYSGPDIGGRHSRDPRAHRIEAMADGLAALIDRGHTPTVGRQYAALGRLSEIAMQAVRAEGHRPWSLSDGARMAMHSSSDFPLILENALGKVVARRFEQRQPDILRAARKVMRMDYRESKTLTLGPLKRFAEVGEGGEIPYSTMDEKGERNPVPRDFGGIFSVTQKAIVNDDMGFFDNIARLMTDSAVTAQRNVLLAPLLANAGAGQNMADGNPLFHTSHGNLAASGAVLDVDTLSAARTAMRKQTGLAGELLAIEPWALVVPAELETKAQQLLADLQATKLADVNPFSGQLELIVEPGLTSATAWYVIANPNTYEGLTWATLDGMDAPRVESKPGWNTLGMEFRVVWALDAAFTEHATWYRNPGA